MKKKLLTSLISIISCAVTGVMWVRFIWDAGISITDNYLTNSDDYDSTSIFIDFLIICTFFAVSGCYYAAEKLGMKAGFSRKDFFIWFCVIPFVFCFAADIVCQLTDPEFDRSVLFSAILSLEMIAYIMIPIFCVIRLGIIRLAALFRKTETVSERNDISDVYNSKS